MAETINSPIERINDKLKADFGLTISLAGFDELKESFDTVMDYETDALREINKATLLWSTYLTDLYGIVFFYTEQYKNVRDIYEYLLSISVKNTDEFIEMAPKYKIDATNIPFAIKTIEDKIESLTSIIKDFKILLKHLDSYKKLVIANYYRTTKLIQSSIRREWNVSF